MHSNAVEPYSCTTTLPVYGTWVMYGSSSGQSLSSKILSYVGWKSPGSNDQTCTDDVCYGGPLGEITQTNAVAAYVESEFHSWNSGKAWLGTSNTQWGFRVAAGVDSHLGYP